MAIVQRVIYKGCLSIPETVKTNWWPLLYFFLYFLFFLVRAWTTVLSNSGQWHWLTSPRRTCELRL